MKMIIFLLRESLRECGLQVIAGRTDNLSHPSSLEKLDYDDDHGYHKQQMN